MPAYRIFQKMQALEKEVKELYLKASFAGTQTAATAALDLTADITLTSVATGVARNTTTFTLQVLAAAANPAATVLVSFTGTAAAIVCTVTPNDGTNNAATPVNLTTAQLRELITTGAVVGKTITLTDASSLRALQTATGGGATNLADGGEGDGVVATFSGGVTSVPSIVSGAGIGFSSIARNGVGDYTVTLSDKYVSLKYMKAIVLDATGRDIRCQLHTVAVDTGPTIRFLLTAGATPADLPDGAVLLVAAELKNSSV
jgi:hypothetical protein